MLADDRFRLNVEAASKMQRADQVEAIQLILAGRDLLAERMTIDVAVEPEPAKPRKRKGLVTTEGADS